MEHNEDNFTLRARELVSQMTEDEKLGLLSTHHNAVERLGLPEFFIGTEVARGFVGRDKDHYSTVFPQPEGLAATFDTELLEQLGRIAGTEARAWYNQDKKGGLCLWGPTVDMVRDPRWGRTEEAYGEDPFLAGQLTAAYTRGMAGEQDGYWMTVPTLKHFCANNNEQDRGSCNAVIPLRLKHEYYYAAFENPIRFGGARSVMAAYNEINGLPAVMNPELGTKLRDEWGLWFAVSDGGDFTQNVTAHRFSETLSESYAVSLTAGCDIMTDSEQAVRKAARCALEKGLLTWDEIDESVVRTITARLRLGQLDETPFDKIGKEIIDCEAHRETNLRAAREQVVMLTNRGLLPIEETPENIAVVGPLADENLMDWYTGYSPRTGTVLDGIRAEYTGSIVEYDTLWDRVTVLCPNGKYLSAKPDGTVKADAERVTQSEIFELQDWGENWKNLFSVACGRYVRMTDEGTLALHNRRIYDWFTRETFNLFELDGKTIIEEFLDHRRLCCDSDGNLSFTPQRAVCEDMRFRISIESSGEQRAADIADRNDLVIYCVGNHPTQTAKECYDRRTLSLNIQKGMTFKMAMHNPNTLLVIVSSYPYSLDAGEEYSGAALWTSHAGEFLGRAVAETVRGKNPPSGKLPLTWYRSEHELPSIMNYDIETSGTTYLYYRGKPLFPFGHGLTYGEFEYADLTAEQTAEGIRAELTVTNTSQYDSGETVELYFRAKDSEVSRPLKKLCAFTKIFLKAGESRRVTLEAPSHVFRVYDLHAGKMINEAFTCVLMAGSSSEDIRCEYTLPVKGEHIAVRPAEFDAITCDRSFGTTVKYSKKYKKSYLLFRGWPCKAVFEKIPTEGISEITITASSLIGERDIKLTLGDSELTVKIAPSDGYEDFGEYTAKLTEAVTGDTLTVTMGGECCLLGVRIN
ncbi:MAG: glycoside hydrolase family 3 C-terminal domain-containing protein [Ruminococcus sp.]|nr:glycoside hydrolase family 3 C-terminal domain-containing protein [Ruminococcus sp.]